MSGCSGVVATAAWCRTSLSRPRRTGSQTSTYTAARSLGGSPDPIRGGVPLLFLLTGLFTAVTIDAAGEAIGGSSIYDRGRLPVVTLPAADTQLAPALLSLSSVLSAVDL